MGEGLKNLEFIRKNMVIWLLLIISVIVNFIFYGININTFLESIIVYPDRLEFTFKFPIFNGSYSSSVGSDIFVRSNTTVSTIVLLRTKVSMSDFKSNIIENIDFTFTIA